MFNVEEIRKDFPILSQTICGKPLVYLDNGATTQIPTAVLDTINEQYTSFNGNVHRGIHYLSEQSTMRMENAREIVSEFLNAKECGIIIFTSGATDSINLVAQSYLRDCLGVGDKVVTTELEHHSNYVVWQQLCLEKKAEFVVIPSNDGELDLEYLDNYLDERVKLLAVTAVSNVTGTVNDLEYIIKRAHEYGIPVLVDAAQGMRHIKFDMESIDCEFLCFSGHKMMAPSGTGVLYINNRLKDKMKPYRYGGGMVSEVSCKLTTFGTLPGMLEAGTPNISGNIALGTAIEYLKNIGLDDIREYEELLINRLIELLSDNKKVHILGNPKKRAGAVSFYVDNVHPFDLATMLDKQGIAIRSGSHCAQPILTSFNQSVALRVSPAFYNTTYELEYFSETLDKMIDFFNSIGR